MGEPDDRAIDAPVRDGGLRDHDSVDADALRAVPTASAADALEDAGEPSRAPDTEGALDEPLDAPDATPEHVAPSPTATRSPHVRGLCTSTAGGGDPLSPDKYLRLLAALHDCAPADFWGEGPYACPRLTFDIQQLYANLVCWVFPEQPHKAIDVGLCESGLGRHPDTFRDGALHGGPYQIAREWRAPTEEFIDGWEEFFLVEYGWRWESIVNYPPIHVVAVRIIYDRSGDWSPWPTCGLVGNGSY